MTNKITHTNDYIYKKTNMKAARDKANLMDQVQDEIRMYNTSTGDGSDYYLSERNRIEGTHRMTDMILE